MFRALMAAHAPEFERSPGRAWLELQHDDFTAALAGWRRFQEIERLVATDRAAFESSAQYLASTIEATLQGSVWSTLSDAMVRARLTAERAESHLAQVALGVLSVVLLIAIALGFGVIGPARRLLEGTRSLGRGALDVRVARGGVRELDELAGAFNDMAQALHSTQQALREQHEALERRVAERTAQLRHLANHDALTALPNRRELESHLTAAINRARTGTTGCAVLYLDIDNFKTMNDSLGHHFGDCVLREIADRLRVMTSDQSFLARLGGDEFTFVVEGIDSGLAAEAVAADVIRAFQTPIRAGNRDLLITVSIGISLCPEHGVATESLLQAADTALFYAKERGRNGYALYRSELLAAASHRFHTEQGLRRALDAGDLLLYLQPEISLKDLKATAVEALLRWRKPDGRIAAASEFIGIAEQSGLILEVSEWVLRSAIDVARQLRSGPWPMARIAVNVSPQQFLTGRFVDKVRNALHDARMPPDCLEIELTETAVQTGRGAIEAAHELRRLGVAVALDDFGAGYSSLKSLEELPLSRVKLDKSLTRSIDSSPSAAAIAVSVIGLCQELGLTVTAEGIQRTAQLDVLSPWGPLDVQGYLIARPTPIHDIARVIAESPGRLAAVWHRPARGPVHASELPAVVTSFRPRAR